MPWDNNEVPHLKLHLYPDPILTTLCGPCLVRPSPGFIGEMHRLCKLHKGLAIAAPQVGMPLRFFVLSSKYTWRPYTDNSPSNSKRAEIPLCWMNPEIVAVGETTMFRESCLSLPGVEALNKRYTSVGVRFTDVFGQSQYFWATGLLAIVVQHEISHLNGQLFVDMLAPFERQKADRAINKLRRKKSHG